MDRELLKFSPPLTNSNGRRFVIPDIHGCYYSFKGLLDKIKLAQSDHLFLLGDYFELDQYFLVHAGFNFNCDNPFEDFFSMVWIKDFEVDTNRVGTKKIIHGHYTTDLDTIKESIHSRSRIIPLDNGCYLKKNEQKGNLLCLELGNMSLYIQENIEIRG
jgi:serine/threonine protein phosphatase 1